MSLSPERRECVLPSAAHAFSACARCPHPLASPLPLPLLVWRQCQLEWRPRDAHTHWRPPQWQWHWRSGGVAPVFAPPVTAGAGWSCGEWAQMIPHRATAPWLGTAGPLWGTAHTTASTRARCNVQLANGHVDQETTSNKQHNTLPYPISSRPRTRERRSTGE